VPTRKQGAKKGAMKRKGLSDAAAERIAGIKKRKKRK
jgi:hypothetical protein